MTIPFMDLSAQLEAIRPEIAAAMDAVMAANAYIKGPFVETFEREFADFNGAAQCVGVGNGTDALFLALKAMGIGAGDEVLVPAMTFVATSEAVTMTGARPVFVDVDAATYTINPDLLGDKLTDRTRAVIPVHLYGHPADMATIRDFANRHGLKIVQDAAQAHGATFDGRRLMDFGDCLGFSFYPGKNLGAYGDAGGLVTNDPKLAERARMFANHGRKTKYDHEFEGVNSRMDGLQAAVLSVKLRHLGGWTERRRVLAGGYDKALAGIPGVTTPATAPGHVYHQYVILADDREALRAHLSTKGISTGVHYPIALPFLEAYAHMGHGVEDFPVSRLMQSKALSLPIFPELKDEQARTVARAVRDFYS